MRKRVNVDTLELERKVMDQINQGYSTANEIAARLKVKIHSVSYILKMFYNENRLYRSLHEGTWRYTKYFAPAHDPFNLTGKTYEHIRQSDATHS